VLDIIKLLNQLKRDEGFSATLYYDTVGLPTIGYGFNLAEDMSKSTATTLLTIKVHEAIQEVEKYPWFDSLSPARKRVIINMYYNLGGPRFNGFKKMIKAIKSDNYKIAAEEMLDSKWARQVGARAERLAKIMIEGDDHEETT
jgi:lysozyme